jgi:citrate synthase
VHQQLGVRVRDGWNERSCASLGTISRAHTVGVRAVGTLSAEEAASRLGITVKSLYAYVSRGRLRSVPGPDARSRRYLADEVEALVSGRGPDALDWGTPVLDSALCSIVDGTLRYRGRDATAWSRTAQPEEVAAWLWTGADADVFAVPELSPPPTIGARGRDLDRLAVALAELATRPEPTGPYAGARLLKVAARVVGGDGATLAERVGAGLSAEHVDLVRRAMVLCADHELNASSFTARCVIGAGASLVEAVGAGLYALRGARHGGLTDRAEAMMNELAGPDPAGALAARARRGDTIPGFGHRLYPSGDPRCTALLDAMDGPAADLGRAVAAAGAELTGQKPTIDLALGVLARAVGRPGFGLTVFAVGRMIGWIAHAIEQSASDRLLRPRARYVGPDTAPIPGSTR